MSNRWQIPTDVLDRLRQSFKACAYCRRKLKRYTDAGASPDTRATIEHLNRNGPFYWSDGLREEHLVIACARCNSSRGRKRLAEWFESPYSAVKRISAKTVAAGVRSYLRTPAAKK